MSTPRCSHSYLTDCTDDLNTGLVNRSAESNIFRILCFGGMNILGNAG